MSTLTARFRFDALGRIAATPFRIDPDSAIATISGAHLVVRFGPWSVVTPVDNIESAEVTGPFAWFKVVGPPHLSLRDQGLTFGTNHERGVCLRFREPVRGLDPVGIFRHPGLTLTVEDPEDFVRQIEDARTHVGRLAQEEEDEVKNKTASELRAIAKDLSIEQASSKSKDELVEAVTEALAEEETAPTAIAALDERLGEPS